MIILRKEKFGGLVFNTDNAHELKLDNEVFSDLVSFFREKKQKISKETQKAIEELKIKSKNYKIINNQSDFNFNYSFQILSSPTLADLIITTKCNLHCPHCYMDSQQKGGIEMSWDDFLHTLDECEKAGIFQIALGGGEPTLHPQFNKMLREIRRRDMVPNLTTNGYKLNWNTVYSMAKYAGAVALSLEGINDDFLKRRGFQYKKFIKSIKKLKYAGIKLVFQITISKSNVDKIGFILDDIIKYKPYGILFLAYKNQGRAKNFDQTLYNIAREKIEKTFLTIFSKLNKKTKIGFDCCLTPGLINVFPSNSSLSGCSAGRSSIAIMPDLQVVPCSFLPKNKLINLREKSLLDIWQKKDFNNFRQKMEKKTTQDKCLSCKELNICLGGCPEYNLINCYNEALQKKRTD